MILKTFWIRNFKNIKDQTLTFADGNYTTLVGLNGSGKSNWIEAVANVFSHLYNDRKFEFDFSILYELGGETYEIHKLDKDVEIPDNIVIPDRVIACYSGEDTRLWTMSFSHAYDKFLDDLLKGESNEPEMLYLNKSSWGIALVTLLCSEDDDIKHFISQIFEIDGDIDLQRFKLRIKLNDKNIENFKDTRVKSLLLDPFFEQEEYDMKVFSTWDIDDTGDNKKKCQSLYFMLYSALMPDAVGSTKAKKAIDAISISYDGMDAASLSEGNKKQILIELATKILGTTNTLYLFDEPDAHSHISAKGDICKLIENAEGYSLISTHSPSFIAKMKPECIRPIYCGEPNNQAADLLKMVSEISSGEISYIDGALITSKRKILVVEGVYDLNYINRAKFKLSPGYDKLSTDVFSISVNGAQATKDFYGKVVRPLLTNLDRVIFLFDNDDAGRKSKDKLEEKTTKDGANDKVKLLVYTNDYSKEPQHDFYVEDYFPEESWKGYNELESKIRAHDYYSYKKAKNVADSIKSAIEKHYKEFEKKEYWEGFRPLLDELMKQFGFKK